MVAYNFKPQFAAPVSSGEKRQTIRAPRKNGHVKPGQSVQLYTGLRTRFARKLVDPDPICTGAIPVEISDGGRHLRVGGRYVTDRNAFAVADGFARWSEMAVWFDRVHGLPFEGVLILWDQVFTECRPPLAPCPTGLCDPGSAQLRRAEPGFNCGPDPGSFYVRCDGCGLRGAAEPDAWEAVRRWDRIGRTLSHRQRRIRDYLNRLSGADRDLVPWPLCSSWSSTIGATA